MKIKIFLLFYFLLTTHILIAQSLKIGADVGRAYFHYKYKDYGQGYSNAPKANHGFTAQITIVKDFTKKGFWETGLKFVLYEQYYTTRLYNGTWEQRNAVFYIPALLGYKISKSKAFISVKGGMLLGIMPDQYESEYAAFYVRPSSVDSITRGTMKRDFTPVFPLINLGLGIGYKINSKFFAEMEIAAAIGFLRITEFDIYYNDGSGKNDQRAKQWGKGDFANITIGMKYLFTKK